MKYVLIVIYLILTVSGLILMKKGGNSGTIKVADGDINFGINIISLLGFICYIGSFLIYTRLILMFDLSYIVPISTGIVQVATLVSAKVIFKEAISTYGVIGASLVILGIIVMNFKVKA